MNTDDGDDTGSAVVSLTTRRNDGLRREAALAYISTPSCESLEALAEDPRFTGRVSVRTLERWCAEDKWVGERQQFLATTYAEMRRRAADALSQALVHDVNMLIDVRKQMHMLLMSGEILPKSYEGMARAFVDMSRRIEEVARIAAERLVPGGMHADAPTQHILPEDITVDELDAMAKAALQLRRGEIYTNIAQPPIGQPASVDDAALPVRRSRKDDDDD